MIKDAYETLEKWQATQLITLLRAKWVAMRAIADQPNQSSSHTRHGKSHYQMGVRWLLPKLAALVVTA